MNKNLAFIILRIFWSKKSIRRLGAQQLVQIHEMCLNSNLFWKIFEVTEVLPLTIALQDPMKDTVYIRPKNQTFNRVVRKRLGGPLVPPFLHSRWAMRDAAACEGCGVYCLVSILCILLSLSKSRLTADHYSCRGPRLNISQAQLGVWVWL